VKTRIRALVKLGADPNQAYYWGCTRKGYWRISNSHILTTTLTTDFLKQRGWSWLGCFRG
ncbi:MAG TPA: group II intron reverse transcriptase/maturase, partial [Parasutterella excrementihominis]|nr:group II intron reverse transcriptase/maturase [Parasutterella excrementihominis]